MKRNLTQKHEKILAEALERIQLNVIDESKSPLVLDTEHIYILQEPESYKLNAEIYKIGYTKHIHTRKNNYPSGSQYKNIWVCKNGRALETKIKAKLNNTPNIYLAKGTEYFCGNYFVIQQIVNNIWTDEYIPENLRIDD